MVKWDRRRSTGYNRIKWERGRFLLTGPADRSSGWTKHHGNRPSRYVSCRESASKYRYDGDAHLALRLSVNGKWKISSRDEKNNSNSNWWSPAIAKRTTRTRLARVAWGNRVKVERKVSVVVRLCQLDNGDGRRRRPVVVSGTPTATWRFLRSNEAEASLHADARRLRQTAAQETTRAGRANPPRPGVETARHGTSGTCATRECVLPLCFSSLVLLFSYATLSTRSSVANACQVLMQVARTMVRRFCKILYY